MLLTQRKEVVPEALLSFAEVILGACFLGLCAQIEIPLFFTPVPLTIQTIGVMLIGIFLGPGKGALAALCYLFQGCVGFPVFAGGAAGAIHLIGPTGGYLLGYVAQALIIGYRIEHKKSLFPSLFFALLLQLGLGSLFLSQFVGLNQCLELGFYPFVIPEIIKASCVTYFIKNRRIYVV